MSLFAYAFLQDVLCYYKRIFVSLARISLDG
jgi:hypothetical protein